MTIRILALAAAMALGTSAFAQSTPAPGSTAPTPYTSGTAPAGAGNGASNGLHGSPDLNSSLATGAVRPTKPKASGVPPAYTVPAHPPELSGDDGGAAGKSNPD